MVKRTTEFGAKQKADAQAPVRYQLGVAVISAFGKHKLIRPPVHERRGSLRDCARTSGRRPKLSQPGLPPGVTAQLAGTGICFTGLGRCPSFGRR